MAQLWQLDSIYSYSKVQDLLEILDVKEELMDVAKKQLDLAKQKEQQNAARNAGRNK